MNHARMVKRLAEESVVREERQPLVLGGFEVPVLDTPHHLPLHFIMDVPDINPELMAVAV